jgi:tetratricopeptide (TPR) repeat protein
VTHDNFVAEDDLASALLDAGRPADADAHFRAAAAIRPNDALSHLNIGIYQHKQGNLQGAIEEYKQVLTVTTQRDWRQTAMTNMARAYRDLGDSSEAQKYFAEAAKLSASPH